ncbi:Phosphatidylinositol 4-kinase lsb6 [Golovinomyces cichoracearum]|uniref:Phosphatidylinositol 4-kinase n=1 Tax=Golovinomyces cichoracearum TaxID=62708 RepID=A0A420IXR8_9PEZI|nr:Phosphatidylinositol 4-kinase lsb6 [Golovinomyces cichoracearum]
MPRDRPPSTGYARITQAEEYSDSEEEYVNDHASLQSACVPQFTYSFPSNQNQMIAEESTSPETYKKFQFRRTTRSNSSGVDIKAINARLEKWADEIAMKFKIHKAKGKTKEEEKLEIHHSVFHAPDGVRPATAEMLALNDDQGRMTKPEFERIVESVRIAIEQGIHPKMITQGSSGSYFARNSKGKVIGVFKPKDEEPYAAGNPKWNKWIHRNLFPCFFGRACLIPNLSYVSEAAAYTLDCRLRTRLVPYTDIVHLSSKSFHYDFWHRRNYYKRGKPFPTKVGSFQVFLEGYKDANIFLRENAWPEHTRGGYERSSEGTSRKPKVWETCRNSSSDGDDNDDNHDHDKTNLLENRRKKRFFWTETLQQSFREELEKLVILDYLMRNTDRGLDNWMIKVDHQNERVSITTETLHLKIDDEEILPNLLSAESSSESGRPYRQQKPMNAASNSMSSSNSKGPKILIGAIDNSLSWPWKHPDAWRSFPFGWLFLPVSLIGQPFSQKTRDHFLPLLTSKQWWSETQMELRQVFSQDVDFKERMFARQIAVMKGQAWNVVETLKLADHGPLELTRRARVCVWDDLVDIPVAIPMKMPCGEAKLRHGQVIQEEIDIGAANSPKKQPDLSEIAASPAELPNANRFKLSSPQTGDETSSMKLDSVRMNTANLKQKRETNSNSVKFSDRPAVKPSWSRMSYEGPSRTHFYEPQLERRFSFNSSTKDIQFCHQNDDIGRDDIEGDLGYAAAEGMEGNQRKVIVERLETVKSKNPVFTWC